MEEPENLVQALKNISVLSVKKKVSRRTKGKTILVTAGPTYEPLDAVRFIGNYSSGKMGFALAEALAESGASVILVSGPVALKPHSCRHISIIRFIQPGKCLLKALPVSENADGAILSAAVADYRPKSPVGHKIKSKAENLMVELEPNPDIAAELGQMKQPRISSWQVLPLKPIMNCSNAREKLKKKNFDFIVLNSLQDKGSGFQQRYQQNNHHR